MIQRPQYANGEPVKKEPRPKGTDGAPGTLSFRGAEREEGSASVTHRPVSSSSCNIRHEQPVGHTLLEVLQHPGLPNRHADRQGLAIGCLELDYVCAVILRAVG
jgi:hypothetical protein